MLFLSESDVQRLLTVREAIDAVEEAFKARALTKFATELGATDARIISTNDVIAERRAVLKCKYWCSQYGINWSCPPRVPSVEEFRSILKEYKYVMVIIFKSSAEVSAKATDLLTCREALGVYKGMKELESFYKIWEEDKRKAHEALLKLEKFAFTNGFPFALGLRAGSCTLCPKCDVTKPCVHPEMLRFSPESVGINLIKTLKNAKMSLNVPVSKLGEKPNIVMMLLIT
jgi:predicted metal-binding protein